MFCGGEDIAAVVLTVVSDGAVAVADMLLFSTTVVKRGII